MRSPWDVPSKAGATRCCSPQEPSVPNGAACLRDARQRPGTNRIAAASACMANPDKATGTCSGSASLDSPPKHGCSRDDPSTAH